MYKKAVEFLGLKRNITALLVMVVFIGLGEKMAERFLPLYVLALGGTSIIVGLLNGMDNLLSALYSFPGGYLSDRLGYKKALLVFNLTAMFGYVIVIIFPYWQAVIVGSVFFLSWTAISLPSTMSMIATVLPKNKRTIGVSMHSLVRRIPMGLGPVLGGLFIQYYGDINGVRYAFIAALVMGLLAIVIQQKYITEEKKEVTSVKPSLFLFREMSPQLKQLLISDILIRFCEQIPYAFVVIWVVKLHGLSSLQFGILTAVEMAAAMLIYIPVSYLADKTTKKPYIVITFINFTLFPLVLLFAKSFIPLLFVFILRGLKEFGEPARKALIIDLAPENKKAGAFGLYYLIRDIFVSVAAFGGAFLWDISPELNFITAFLFGAAGTLFFAMFGKE